MNQSNNSSFIPQQKNLHSFEVSSSTQLKMNEVDPTVTGTPSVPMFSCDGKGSNDMDSISQIKCSLSDSPDTVNGINRTTIHNVAYNMIMNSNSFTGFLQLNTSSISHSFLV